MVYVKRARPHEPVIVCKQGKAASINDIAREDLEPPKILIGIFMSPLSVHYNRAPLRGTVADTRQYPAEGKNLHMGSMHWRQPAAATADLRQQPAHYRRTTGP